MKYESSTPIAVFLGPSLEKPTAQEILLANYYPPVRMGDIYRLLGTGVEVIVVIDGVFHEVTPIWQRELVAAMKKGIIVIGASSMGALRAAELADFGMIGCGEIFRWYRDGIIDGDDEVALLHGNELLGYKPLSEPLVNIRYTMQDVVAHDLVSATLANQLVNDMKNRFFALRSFQALLDHPALNLLAAEAKAKLVEFINTEATDLKRMDAIAALKFCADELPSTVAFFNDRLVRGLSKFPTLYSGFPALESFNRGLHRSDGTLVVAESVLEVVTEDSNESVAEHQLACSAKFFLLQYMIEEGLEHPESDYENFTNHWIQTHVTGELMDWLRSVGLTLSEFKEEIRQEAKIEWLIGAEPETFGIDFAPHRQCAKALQSWRMPTPRENGCGGSAPHHAFDGDLLLRRMAEACYITTWAKRRGIQCPQSVISDSIARWEKEENVTSRNELLQILRLTEDQYLSTWSQRAFYHWLIEKGPVYFGYSSFSFRHEFLRQLQVTGGIKKLVEQTSASI